MKDKVCLITGATSGIGKETAKVLAGMGAIVVIPVRDMEKGNNVKNLIVEESHDARVEVFECDLSSFESIRNFCGEFKERYYALHVLVNNAGLWERERKVSADGIELTFAVNHLAPFLMTHLLLDLLKKSAPARIVNVTSGLHQSTIDFDNIEFDRDFSSWKAYRQSKLANILFTKELARRLSGTGVTANCLMPGFVSTGLSRNSGLFSRTFVRMIAARPRKGAETEIYLATAPEVEKISGECFKKKKIAETSKESNDPDLARRLWDVSTKYVERYLI
ncbi:MAG: SDR family oxidoreductase [Thermoplasmata archaeon]|nr:SDR family oxidoreductase [Thermoplasmata archaeon]